MTHRLADRGVIVRPLSSHMYDTTSGFRCVNCQRFVSLARQLSGVVIVTTVRIACILPPITRWRPSTGVRVLCSRLD
jgi:hypothetical protein